MIQRIQTIYLLLAAIFMGIFLLTPSFTQSLLKATVNVKTFSATDNMLLLILAVLVLLIDILGIFLFNNRSLQLKTIWIAIGLNAITLLMLGYWYTQLSADNFGKLSFNFGAILPLITLVLNFLALSGVRKDEKLVKSLDRLR